MQKKMTLSTISYPQRRIKLDTSWHTVSPLLDLDKLIFGEQYDVTFELEKETWYVSELRSMTQAKGEMK